ncbi:MAG TPA: hypothetical protein DEB73_01720 [Candidatus Magasanikbacteria bacterium]|uniref:Uncharacterized protein n=2 Tax=Candidatus Magasanikiibacteriota TaxID=1752731 RepID=A0A0G0WKF7_9BACT|nr:MAG: hypothetical protein UU49_C0002G0025 [Candidatus Magasanikbacteria bacterium GW2011_GWC2_41_17]KKS13289.1 MAG: hypothetical protein UU69_C0009G0024 [Candidatus Magasanikbacteria bacterium GW2011_GWA2_41_55]HBV57964.1 hypothetical protein [Candidatus Magasanikbacteria bacterium]HBX15725.1 hypothetical protein [Candidatus Magasanikbacteria bacterium]
MAPWVLQKDIPSILRRAAALTVVAGLLIYLGINLAGTFSTPPLDLETPIDNSVSAAPNLLVKGITNPETRVQINGHEVISNIKGFFEEPIILNPGLNVIVVRAIKKYGQSTTLIRNVILKEPKDISLK